MKKNSKIPIRKAVLPVAGRGTRLLPATKTVPKEMLHVFDTPVIQYIINEATEAGIEQFIFVNSHNKKSIEAYFDSQKDIETRFVYQEEPLGLGHAVGCAEDVVGTEPFALLLPDMIMESPTGMKEMMQLYNQTGGNIIGVHECDPNQVSQYGIVKTGQTTHNGFAIDDMVEKPSVENAPSNRMINGRYLLDNNIFSHIAKQKEGAGGEIQITDALLQLLQTQKFFGYLFKDRIFDCGSKEGLLGANIFFALQNKEYKSNVKTLIAELSG